MPIIVNLLINLHKFQTLSLHH